MPRVADRLYLQLLSFDCGLPTWHVHWPAARIVLAVICTAFGLFPAQAAPRSGPDRPFTVEWQASIAPAPHLRAASFAPGTMNAIVVGERGTILRTDDGGKRWKRSTVPSGFKSSLSALAFATSLIAIAVGENGAILRTI